MLESSPAGGLLDGLTDCPAPPRPEVAPSRSFTTLLDGLDVSCSSEATRTAAATSASDATQPSADAAASALPGSPGFTRSADQCLDEKGEAVRAEARAKSRERSVLDEAVCLILSVDCPPTPDLVALAPALVAAETAAADAPCQSTVSEGQGESAPEDAQKTPHQPPSAPFAAGPPSAADQRVEAPPFLEGSAAAGDAPATNFGKDTPGVSVARVDNAPPSDAKLRQELLAALPLERAPGGPSAVDTFVAASVRAVSKDVRQPGSQPDPDPREDNANALLAARAADRTGILVHAAFSEPVATTFVRVDAASLASTVPDVQDGARLDTQIVQAIHLQWRDGAGTARVTLEPEYLGRLTVELRVSAGAVTATLHADSPEVRAWIESHDDLLRQGLSERGLSLDRLLVFEGTPSGDHARGNAEARRRWARQEPPRPARTRTG